MKYFFLIITLAFVSISCEKEEDPFVPNNTTNREANKNIVDVTLDLTPTYDYQLFYSLEDSSIVSQNNREDWSLRYSSDGKIWCNTAISVGVASSVQSYEKTTNTLDVTFNYDSPTLIQTPLISKPNTTYIIQKGLIGTSSLGHCKLYYQEKDNNVTITFTNLDGSNEKTITLNKGEGLSFDKGSIPVYHDELTWSLLFTNYIYIYPDGTPYSVTGALMNTLKWTVAKTDDLNFYDIIKDDISSLDYSKSADAIGYDWKTYSLDTHTYTIDSETIYILKNTDGDYYKLRFLDFYNKNGEKGSPRFEYQLLN